MTANSTLTREQLDANPMLESTRVENSGTMSGFTPAQIADSDLPMVMKLLTRAYTRPHEAVVRELVANALDSHRDAGVTDPVEVILPTIDNPSLTVTDHGLGLSPDEFRSVFGNVGASTKRQSLTSTGHMGIVLRFHIEARTSFSGPSEITVATKRLGDLGVTRADLRWPQSIWSHYCEDAAPEDPELDARIAAGIEAWKTALINKTI